MISDIHLYEHANLATYHNGINRRLLDGLKVLDQVWSLCQEKKDDTVYMPGDIFYDRNGVSTVVQSLVSKSFQEAKAKGIKIYMIPGNHDYAPGGEVHHSLHCLSEHVTIYTEPTYDPSSGVCWIPFTSSKRYFLNACKFAEKRRACVLLTHQGYSYKGVTSNWAYFIDEICSPKELPANIPVVSGHYHHSSLIGKHGFYLGSPLQLNWGDENIPKFVWHIPDMRNLSDAEPIALRVPKFKTIQVASMDELVKSKVKVKGHYVRLKVPTGFPLHEGQAHLRSLKPRGIATPVVDVSKQVKDEMEQRAIELASMSTDDSVALLKAYAKQLAKEHQVDYKELLNVLEGITP